MFPSAYFAPTYFTPTYWPPADGDTGGRGPLRRQPYRNLPVDDELVLMQVWAVMLE